MGHVNVVVTIALLGMTAGEASADRSRIKIAVVPSIAVNLDPARVDTLGRDLADAFASELDVDAVGGLEVRRQLPVDGVAPDCPTVPSCVADVAKRLGASQLLFVVMVDATGSGAVQIDSTWVDVATGERASRPAIDVPTISDAKPRFVSGAHSLLPDAPIRPKHEAGGIGVMSPEVPRHLTTTTYAVAGAAAVGLGFGIGFGLRARSKYNACDRPGACGESARDSIRTSTIVADVGFVVAVAGAIATSVLYATSGKESRLVVSPAPGGVSLAAVGRF